MLARLVDFSLRFRLVVFLFAVVLLVGGAREQRDETLDAPRALPADNARRYLVPHRVAEQRGMARARADPRAHPAHDVPGAQALIEEGAIAVVETAARTEPQLPLDLVTTRRYGSARITVFSR